MDIHTQQSISGFIASDPQLTYTERGDARFYAKIGQEHYRREPDGTFTQLDPTFHDLVAFRATAERARERFAKGDSFVAEGYVREYEATRDGEQVPIEQFVAKKLGHDLARTRYEVDRTPRTAPTLNQDTPVQETSARETASRPAPEFQSPGHGNGPTPAGLGI